MANYTYRFSCEREIEVSHPMGWVGNEPQGFFEGKTEGFEQMVCQCGKGCKAWRVPSGAYSQTYLESSSRGHWLKKANGLYQLRKKNEARAKSRKKY
jgi:hypothetical protein